ncbi:uncharacterized protein [Rutidosis leptorrhynchoides]|uniref:uncharacterized protein n=1 Tax=Rutidosis leptorrhynchoides TaxID=125765 RepID=UPI003A99CAE9
MFNLHAKINTIKQNGSSVAEYFNKLNTLWKQYDAMLNLVSCTCDASDGFKKHDKLMRCMQFLMGLDDTYMHTRSNILMIDPFPDVKTAFAIISREESHRGSSSGNNNSKVQHSAFVAQTNKPNFSNYGVVGYPPNFKKPNNPGLSENFKSNNVVTENPSSSSPSNSTGILPTPSTSLSLTNDQIARLVTLLNDTSTSTTTPNFSSNMSDSGANQHMTVSNNNLENVIDVTNLNMKVSHPNGTEAKIRKIGNLKLPNLITLYDVLVVPGYYDSVTRNTLGTGSISGGLYVFDDSQYASLDNKHSEEPCEVCLRAKQSREPFPLSEHVSVSLGDLIHVDLWGPYKVTSREGFKLFLTIVDDYTRAVWVYMLKSKDDVFENLVNFINLIHTRFDKKIKIVRSDNVIEFVNNQTKNFFDTKGIIHQTTIAYTPQQNGIVERKHRHLLNVARSLMFQGGNSFIFVE